MSEPDFKVGDLVEVIENYLQLLDRRSDSHSVRQRLKEDFKNRFFGRMAIVLEDHTNPTFMVTIRWIDTGLSQQFNAGSLKKLNKD